MYTLKRNKPRFFYISYRMYTKLFHKLADGGDKIRSMRLSKPERRLLSAERLAILVALHELMEAFNKPIQTNK